MLVLNGYHQASLMPNKLCGILHCSFIFSAANKREKRTDSNFEQKQKVTGRTNGRAGCGRCAPKGQESQAQTRGSERSSVASRPWFGQDPHVSSRADTHDAGSSRVSWPPARPNPARVSATPVLGARADLLGPTASCLAAPVQQHFQRSRTRTRSPDRPPATFPVRITKPVSKTPQPPRAAVRVAEGEFRVKRQNN
jgi:hypothetical protein